MSSVNAKVVPFDQALTFTRASTATYWDKDGVLRTAQVDEPRFDHDPATGEALGLLIEESRTNVSVDSEYFASGWSSGGLTITQSAAKSPDGAITASKLAEDETNGGHYLYRSFTVVSGEEYTASVFAKAGERTHIAIAFAASWEANDNVVVDLSTGAVTDASDPTKVEVVPAGNGFYRISITGRATASSATINFAYVMDSPLWADRVYTGEGTSGIYIWGAQLEKGAFPTSYIPTSGSSVTRAGDIISRMAGSEISPSAGSIYVEWVQDSSPKEGDSATIFKGIGTLRSPQTTFGVRYYNDSGSSTGSLGQTVVGQSYKFAASFSADETLAALDGGETTSQADGVTPQSVFYIGSDDGSANYFNGHIKRLEYYPRAMSATELEALTA